MRATRVTRTSWRGRVRSANAYVRSLGQADRAPSPNGPPLSFGQQRCSRHVLSPPVALNRGYGSDTLGIAGPAPMAVVV